MNRKGFLFVVTMFLILTYILLSIRIWVKGMETSERLYSEFYKESNVELAMEQVTLAKFDEVSNIIMSRALYRLNNISIYYPVRAGGPSGHEDEFKYVELALRDALMNGTLEKDYFDGKVVQPREENSSLSAWIARLNSSLNSISVYVSDFRVYDFGLSQNATNTVNYSFRAYLALKDRAGTVSLSRTYTVSNYVDITGFVDPALARESRKITAGAEPQPIEFRQFFFHKDYQKPSDLTPMQLPFVPDKRTGATGYGIGWFYGPLMRASAKSTGEIPAGQRHAYIVYGTYEELIALKNPSYMEFGAVILTNAPVVNTYCTEQGGAVKYANEEQTFWPITYTHDKSGKCVPAVVCLFGDCPQLPFIVFPNFDIAFMEDCPGLVAGTSGTKKCTLILSAYSYDKVVTNIELKKKAEQGGNGGIYSLQRLRDFAGCGYYLHNGKAPSYLQRLFEGAYGKRNSSLYGIETFVIGEYANHTAYDSYSRIDRKLFNSTGTKDKSVFIRGMPGCKDASTCGGSPTTGKFALDEESMKAYLGVASGIACNVMARCDG